MEPVGNFKPSVQNLGFAPVIDIAPEKQRVWVFTQFVEKENPVTSIFSGYQNVN